MSFSTIMQQVSQYASAVSAGLNQLDAQQYPGMGAVPGGPLGSSAVIPQDTYSGTPSAPVYAPVYAPVPIYTPAPVTSPSASAASAASSGSGFVAALANLWDGIVGFFKNLFGLSSTPATPTPVA